MKILKFALGVRFDFLKDRYDEDDVSFILNELTKVLSATDTAGLHLYGGLAKLNERDSEGVFTVVFMNGKMKPMRAVYKKISGDAVLACYLDHRIPFIQNNIVRSFEGLTFYGVIGEDGWLTEGEGGFSFPSELAPRMQFSESGSIVLAPNAFKGTISSCEAVRHLMKTFRDVMPERNLVPLPIADGGDGTLDAIENAVLCMRHGVEVNGPDGESVHAEYLVIDGSKAVIESALSSGLALMSGKELSPMTASSFGTGELILRALHEGLKNIYVCLGGSATNDCGLGLARALGVKFLKEDVSEAVNAEDMELIRSIDTSDVDPLIKGANIYAVCDVKNPLTGINGATYTFGPQKGADEGTLALLEKGMLNMETLLNEYAKRGACSEAGAGAAGGMGAMLIALFGAKVLDGSETVFKLAELDEKLAKASLVITGEGRIDATSANGKALGEIMAHARKANVPFAFIAGSVGEGADAILNEVCAYELTGSEKDALLKFDEAARRLALGIKEM